MALHSHLSSKLISRATTCSTSGSKNFKQILLRIPLFPNKNKNISNESHFTRNQTHYSEDEKYLNRNQQLNKP